jgi:hypothetical protein
MAIQIMTQVWDSGISEHFPYCVLLELADQANEKGECLTSVERVRRKWRMSESLVIDSLKRLQSERWILLDQDIPADPLDTFPVRINVEKFANSPILEVI